MAKDLNVSVTMLAKLMIKDAMPPNKEKGLGNDWLPKAGTLSGMIILLEAI